MPVSWIATLSPEAARMQSLAIAGMARESMTLSLDPHATLAALLKAIAYSGMFFLVLALSDYAAKCGFESAVCST